MRKLYIFSALNLLCIIGLDAQSAVRLIGFELSKENIYFIQGTDLQNEATSSITSGISPAEIQYYSNVGSPFLLQRTENGPNNQMSMPYYEEIKYTAKQVNLKAIFQFKGKKGYNPHHLVSIGIFNQKTSRLGLGFSDKKYGNWYIQDSVGTAVFNNQTSPVDTVNVSGKITQAYVSSKKLGLSIGYKYRVFPKERFSLSFGAGIDAGYIYKGFIDARNIEYNVTYFYVVQPYTSMIGTYYSELNNIKRRQFFTGGFSARPYIDAAINWQLSRKAKFLKNLSLTAECRVGKDITHFKNCSNYSLPFASWQIGITYLFSRYYA